MGDNLNPLDELKSLDQQVELVSDLAGLRPIFDQLDEIAKDNQDDFEVQLVVGDIKQHLVNRGTKLKEMAQAVRTPGAIPVPPPGPPPAPPGPPPVAVAPTPTVRIPSPAPVTPTFDADKTVVLPPSAAKPPTPASTPAFDPDKTVVLPPAAAKPVTPAPIKPAFDADQTVVLPPSAAKPITPAFDADKTVVLPPSAAPVPPPVAAKPTPAPAPTAPAPPAPAPPQASIPKTVTLPQAPAPEPTKPLPPDVQMPKLMSSGNFAPKPPQEAAAQPLTPPVPAAPQAPVPPPVQPASPPKAAPLPAPEPPATPPVVAPPPVAAKPIVAPPPVQAKPPVAPAPIPPVAAPPAPKPVAEPPAPKPVAPKPPAPVQIPAQPPPQTKPKSAKGALWIGAGIGAAAAIVGAVLMINMARKKNPPPPVVDLNAAVAIEINTTPPGAKVRINNEEKCAASPCTLQLTPASYSITAFLDGYDPATSGITVESTKPATVSLALEPQAQSLRILTDLETGKVVIDDQPPADLQEGQFVVDKLAPGAHTVKVTGKTGEATFTFEVAPARAPQLTGPVTAKNLNAVLISTFGNAGRIATSSAPVKLSVDGQPQGEASSAGTDLPSFPPGVHELVLGEGKDQKNVKENFGPAPMLTAFLKSDLNIGTLIVSTGEDDVTVFLNNREYRRKTQRGQVRIQTIGAVNVRVTKNGFETLPPQTADIKKGAEVRMEFKLKPLAVVGVLQIRGGTPGAEVLLDLKSIGTIGPDGNFNYNGVQPGDHAIELRRDQFTPKRYSRNFRAGQPLVLTGGDVVLAAAAAVAPANGTVRVARNPAEASVTYRRVDETQAQARDLRGGQIELPPGGYIFAARAPGYTERTERVQLAAGENRNLELALNKVAPVIRTGTMADFEDPSAWKQEDGVFVHRGEAFLPYRLTPKGVFTFTVQLIKGGGVFRAGRIRWRINYVDARNFAQFEIDKKNFWARDNVKGRNTERAKTQHDLKDAKSFTVQIEVTADHIVHKLRTAEGWVIMDSWAQPGRDFTQGKFGFWIQGSDEVGITDFTFVPK